ncbi:Putative succinyl-CoA ligase [GDP-forming] subunit beta, mitochondrial [Tolypocladium paradoxum]|uniref:Succinyl-CoA ligase [GDP-forming] subunit beta, mitochondrial n=1 Tax=Tolypocladium paradoxum TaxID=94208 RepID=A0A2S4KX63_9HYPO|nr:Putative succinyl-CoA ligase [GDP-forming] subunit beta, mitochondrial [Tolypocladium paradoxum]
MAQNTALRQASRLIAPGPLRSEPLRAFSTSGCQHAGASAAEAASRLLDTFSGSVSIRRQLLDANQIQKLALTLGRPVLGGADVSDTPPRTGTPIPPGHHLVYFTSGGLETELGHDGTDSTFNAPEPFTRRMWAGGKMSWPDAGVAGGATILVGDEVEERTRLVSATAKKSTSAGEMVLVEVEKELRAPRGYSVVDRRSWIFRPEIDPEKVDAYAVSAGEIARGPTIIQDIPADDGGQSSFPVRQLCWSPVGLFRFSALTFNGHKIHYNEEWSRRVEGHPGAVVHGPLNLINILDYWRDVHGGGGNMEPARITYRAMSPIYAGETYNIRTEGTRESRGQRIIDIVAEKNGTVCMKSEVVMDLD